MVGVPRSTACALCLSRRVKCDEIRPSCSNCVKYGADCPGYARGVKFVAGKHVVKSRARRGTVAFAVSSRTSNTTTTDTTPSTSTSSSSSPSTTSFSPSRSDGTRRPPSRQVPDAVSPTRSRGILPPRHAPVREDDAGEVLEEGQEVGSEQIGGQARPQQRYLTSHEKLQSALAHVNAVSVMTPRDNRAQFIGMLMKSLEESQPESEMVVLGTWFQQTTAHLGQKPSLDRASCAFALQLLGRNHHDEGLLAQSRTLYGQSLGMLQQALNHPTEWKTPETLNSAMILCHFEVRGCNRMLAQSNQICF
ncbi:uncharacterized protein PG986_008286 [Apiospora aurea]|uniref:Zn(2)-C6 fungal-type domain-containing protein n=1 Tax=Apiospora aurea TaxID=335848 RepID=A0ABR1QEZ7_9PEZI